MHDDCLNDCAGTPGGSAINDECGVCGGNNSTCLDCAGTINGDTVLDNCGTCDADSSNDCVQDCSGEWGGSAEFDECGVCGGPGPTSSCGCDDIPEDYCDCDGNTLDQCGVCGGNNSTCPTVTDIDDNLYGTVQIGNQLWMRQNLKTTVYNDESEIPKGHSYGDEGEWATTTEGAYAEYDTSASNYDYFGYYIRIISKIIIIGS
jgi:hypothetical protein